VEAVKTVTTDAAAVAEAEATEVENWEAEATEVENWEAVATEVVGTVEAAVGWEVLICSWTHITLGVDTSMPTSKSKLNAVHPDSSSTRYQLPPDNISFSTGATECRHRCLIAVVAAPVCDQIGRA
jgi:hypothetical protein